MNKFEVFFERLDQEFLVQDKEEFAELKADLQEQIEIMMADGLTEAEILAKLGDPKNIAASFYEEKRLYKAENAAKDIVPLEEVQETYRREWQLKQLAFFQSLLRLLTFLVSLVLVGSGGYFLLFAGYLLFWQQQLNFAALAVGVMFLISGSAFLLGLKKNSLHFLNKFRVIGWLALAGGGLLLVSRTFVFTGIRQHLSYEVQGNAVEVFQLTSDYPINIETVNISADKQFRVEVDGYLLKSASEDVFNVEEQRLTVTMAIVSFFSPLIQPKQTEVTVYLPVGKVLTDFAVAAADGSLYLGDFSVKNMAVTLGEGEVDLTNITAEQVLIESEQADLLVQDYQAELTIKNQHGRSILKEGAGRVAVRSTDGLINLHMLEAPVGEVVSSQGKIIITDSQIADLSVAADESTSVLERLSGTTAVENQTGKIVLNELAGVLTINNHSGTIIVNQSQFVEAQVNSGSGLVKWVQADDANIFFDTETQTGTIKSDFIGENSAVNHVKIKTDSGDITIIKKEATPADQ